MHHYVLLLDVSVDHPTVVHVVKTKQDVVDELCTLLLCEYLVLLQTLDNVCQVTSSNQLRYDVYSVFVLEKI